MQKEQLKNTDQIKKQDKNEIKSIKKKIKEIKIFFQDLINLAEKNKEMELKYDLERNVKLV